MDYGLYGKTVMYFELENCSWWKSIWLFFAPFLANGEKIRLNPSDIPLSMGLVLLNGIEKPRIMQV